MIIEIIPFQEIRLQSFVYNGVEKDYATKLDVKSLATSYAKMGISFMGIVDDRLIGMGGVYQVLPGIGQAWLFVNREVQKYRGAFFREVKAHLDKIIAKMEYKQVNMMCVKDSFEANNLAEHLDFKKKMDFTLYTKSGE